MNVVSMIESSTRRLVRDVRSKLAAFGVAFGEAPDELGLLPAVLGHVRVASLRARRAERLARSLVQSVTLGGGQLRQVAFEAGLQNDGATERGKGRDGGGER